MPKNEDPTAIRPLLKRVGLDDREAEIYLALLALKVAPASTVAKEANQQRSNTYLILRELQKKGLVSEIERGKVRHFVAEPPQRLIGFLQDRERDIKDVKMLVEGAMPLLSSLTRPLAGKPRMTMYSGISGMKQAYRDTLTQEFIGAFNVQKMYETFGMTTAELLFGDDVQIHGRDLAVDNDGGKRYVKEWKETETHKIRLLPMGVHFDGDIMTFGETIVLFAYDDDKTVIRIDNQQLAETLRAWLEMMWGVSRRP